MGASSRSLRCWRSHCASSSRDGNCAINAARRAGPARPSILRSFFQDNSSRCRVTRRVSRQKRGPNRSWTNPTRRRSVQRGWGSAPAMGGWAAACWAARSSALRPAAMVGQKGGGRRCAGRSAPRRHAHCRRAATPSRFAGDGLCGWPPPWHRRLGSSRAAPGNAHGCADERRSGQAGANRPWFDPTAHSQRITPVLTGPPRRKPLYANRHRPTNRLNYGFQTGRGLTAMKCPTLIASIARDLEEGHACVLQVVSTNEALLDRRLAEIPASEWGDLTIDITPREYVLSYLQHSFPP